jgi:ABC-2 type transport system permease protein
MLLSGFMFPFEAMPVPAQRFGQCPPLTHVLRIVRDILLKGARIGDLAGEVAALVVAVVPEAVGLRLAFPFPMAES